MSASGEVSGEELAARRARLRALRERAKKSRSSVVEGATMSAEAAIAGDSSMGSSGPAGRPGQRLLAALTAGKGTAAGGSGPVGGGPAARLAMMLQLVLQRRGDSKSPTIPGTSFTEEGVATLLDWLKNRTEALGPAQRRLAGVLHKFLTAPPPGGQELIAGANLDNLKRLDSFLAADRNFGPARSGPGAAKRGAQQVSASSAGTGAGQPLSATRSEVAAKRPVAAKAGKGEPPPPSQGAPADKATGRKPSARKRSSRPSVTRRRTKA